MSVESIKQQIEKENASLATKLSDFEARRTEIIKQLKPFIQSELKKIVENEVKRNPEHTKALGVERLSEMKKQLTSLLEESDSLVDTVFQDDSLWVYVNYSIAAKGDSWGQKNNNTKKAETCIKRGIKRVLGKAGKILIDFDYAKAGSKYETTAQWQCEENNEIVLGSNYGFYMPSDIEKTIKEYCDQIENLHDNVEQLEKLKTQLLEQEAVDLWEQV